MKLNIVQNEAFHDYSRTRAREQHKTLLTHLHAAGWMNIHFHLIPLGYMGAIPLSLTTTMKCLSVPTRTSIRLQIQLHFHSITSSTNIISHYHKIIATNDTDPRTTRPP